MTCKGTHTQDVGARKRIGFDLKRVQTIASKSDSCDKCAEHDACRYWPYSMHVSRCSQRMEFVVLPDF
jgi:hypothetical protein